MNSELETYSRLRWLFENKINQIINLTETLGSGLDYAACISNTSAKTNQTVTYTPIPIRDYSTPSGEKIIEILDVIDLSLQEGRNIYIHCYAGIGRTGMIIGCYLARHGLTGPAALEMIQELRMGTPNNNSRSPETEAQRRMVIEWIAGH